jgi:hypothetical protein
MWASGGVFHDYVAHNVDECCWMKNAWPISAQGLGARCYRGSAVDQNFDTYAIEYTFERVLWNSTGVSPETLDLAQCSKRRFFRS